MRDVAYEAGVSISTVSKALRNDPTIPDQRCLSIQAIADRLGYRPHPMVSALMAQMHHHRRRSDPHNIAWLDLWPDEGGRVTPMSVETILNGAEARARELGYGLEIYPVGAKRISPEKLRRTLAARGQWGVIIPPVPESAMRFALDLRGLTGFTIGTSLHEPVMHRVSPNHFQGFVLAWTELRARGFQRIGFVLTPEMNERVECKWLGAYLACQQQILIAERVAPLLVARDDVDSLSSWLGRENPEAILLAEEFAWPAAHVVPIAWLVWQGHPGGLGGLDLRSEQLGRVAVEMVVAQIHRNERASPAIPHTILIDAAWVDA